MMKVLAFDSFLEYKKFRDFADKLIESEGTDVSVLMNRKHYVNLQLSSFKLIKDKQVHPIVDYIYKNFSQVAVQPKRPQLKKVLLPTKKSRVARPFKTKQAKTQLPRQSQATNKETEEINSQKLMEETAQKMKSRQEAVRKMDFWSQKRAVEELRASISQAMDRWLSAVTIKNQEQFRKLDNFRQETDRKMKLKSFRAMSVYAKKATERYRRLLENSLGLYTREKMPSLELDDLRDVEKVKPLLDLPLSSKSKSRLIELRQAGADPIKPFFNRMLKSYIEELQTHFKHAHEVYQMVVLVPRNIDAHLLKSFLFDNFSVALDLQRYSEPMAVMISENKHLSLRCLFFDEYETMFADSFVHSCLLLDLATNCDAAEMLQLFQHLYTLLDDFNKGLSTRNKLVQFGDIFQNCSPAVTYLRIDSSGDLSVKTNNLETYGASLSASSEQNYQLQVWKPCMDVLMGRLGVLNKVTRVLKPFGSLSTLKVVNLSEILEQFVFAVDNASRQLGLVTDDSSGFSIADPQTENALRSLVGKLDLQNYSQVEKFVYGLQLLKELTSKLNFYYRKADKYVSKVADYYLSHIFDPKSVFNKHAIFRNNIGSRVAETIAKILDGRPLVSYLNRRDAKKMADAYTGFLAGLVAELSEDFKEKTFLGWGLVDFFGAVNLPRMEAVAREETSKVINEYTSRLESEYELNYFPSYFADQEMLLKKRDHLPLPAKSENHLNQPMDEMDIDVLHDLLLM